MLIMSKMHGVSSTLPRLINHSRITNRKGCKMYILGQYAHQYDLTFQCCRQWVGRVGFSPPGIWGFSNNPIPTRGQIMSTALLLAHPDLKTQRHLCIVHSSTYTYISYIQGVILGKRRVWPEIQNLYEVCDSKSKKSAHMYCIEWTPLRYSQYQLQRVFLDRGMN